MKAFNILTVVLALFVGGLLLTSCGDEAAANNPNNTPTSESQETTTPPTQSEVASASSINLAELDSMKNNIENLKKQVCESTDRIDKYENEIKNLKEQESGIKLYLLISLAVGIISLVIAIVSFVKASKFNKRLNKHGNDIYNLKQSSDSRFAPVSRQNASDDFYQLKSWLKILEDEVKALKRPKSPSYDDRISPYIPKQPSAPVPIVESKKGYFGQPAQADRGYFKSFLTTRDSEARFSAEEKNNVANFEPLLSSRAELETMLHTDAAKLAVDFQGCSLQEATQATVVKPGVAKFEGNRWYITQKALVALTR